MLTSQFSAQEISGVPLACLRLRYELSIEMSSHPGELSPPFDEHFFTLAGGRATLAGHPLLSAHLSRTGVHWSESVPGKGYWCGVFRFSPDRLWFRGFLHYGPDAGALTSYEVMGAVRRHDFTIETASRKRSVLSIGYSNGSVRTAPQRHIELDGADITNRATLEHVPGAGLNLHISKRRNLGHPQHDWIASGWMNLDLGSSTGAGLVHVNHPAQRSPSPERWSASSSTAAVLERQAGTADLTDTPTPLSVQDLATCDLSGAEAQSQDLIQQNLLWSIEQNWIDAFFPAGGNNTPSRPNLTGQNSRMAVVDQDCEWYNFRFAPACLGLGIEAATPTLGDANRLKLQYYLTNQICLEPAYTRQTEAVAPLAAVQASPRLAEYVNDTSHPANYWGPTLYAYLTTPQQLTGLINTINTNPEPGVAQLDDYATLLTVFDETGQLASNYYNQVLLALTALLALQADSSQDPDMPAWLPDYFNQFIQNYYLNLNKIRPTDPGPGAAFDVAEELFNASAFFGGIGQLGQQFWTALRNTQNPQIGEQAQAIASANSRLARSTFTVLLALGLAASIYALTNWDSLPTDTQAAAVVNLVQAVYGVIVILPDITILAGYTARVFAAQCQLALTSSETLGAIAATEATLLISRPTLTQRLFEWLGSKFNKASGTLNLTGTRIASLFGTTKALILIRGIGAVFAAAGFAISIWTLVADIQTGSGAVRDINLAFDGVQVILGFVLLACAIGSAIPVFDVFPAVLGIAAAALSALLAIAQTLFNWLTEPNAAQQYIDGPVASLLQTLPVPPAGWTPPPAPQPA